MFIFKTLSYTYVLAIKPAVRTTVAYFFIIAGIPFITGLRAVYKKDNEPLYINGLAHILPMVISAILFCHKLMYNSMFPFNMIYFLKKN